jgi:hypothetical protein
VGTATSTTTSPDYAAQARAADRISARNATVAAMNAQMLQSALTANTLSPGQSIAGYVYFKSADAKKLHPRIPIGDKVFEFEF